MKSFVLNISSRSSFRVLRHDKQTDVNIKLITKLYQTNSSIRKLGSLLGLHKGEPIRGMCRQQSHGVAFVKSQTDVDQIADEENKLLQINVRVDVEAFEGLPGREYRLERPN